MPLPVFYIKHTNTDEIGLTVLAGDVGATKTSLGLFKISGEGELHQIKEETYHTKEFTDITILVSEFIEDLQPDSICLGVAGPVEDDKVKMTNIAQELNTNAISKAFHHIPVTLINDLEATAYGLKALKENEWIIINEGNKKDGNIAVIAPGTGLGEAGVYWDGQAHQPFATEGGHCDFFPRTETDIELYRYLQQQFGHVSWERILSGQGIYNIYLFLKEIVKMDEPKWLADKMNTDSPAAAISSAAQKDKVPICSKTIELFFHYLAAESANLVLKLKATGGLFIGGGIIPKIHPLLNIESFRKHFCNNGRLGNLLQDVPIKIILNDKTALLGAAHIAAFRKSIKMEK